MLRKASDGLWGSELFKDWNPKMKSGAPDPEYFGSLEETDTRIRAMFRELKGIYDPHKAPFGKKELVYLHQLKNSLSLGSDARDLLDHYDDDELIRISNILPAI